jgi:pimeloyl-ACP methyl ester carboxylesterase
MNSSNINAQSVRKTFVLVHGIYGGGWCWRRVSDLLERHGHKVFSPTLTGLGERLHLVTKDINLDTHITDIVNVFNWEDLTNVCLVVHSYGGWIGSGVVEQIAQRISSIVWLDAFKPQNGQMPIDLIPSPLHDFWVSAHERGDPTLAVLLPLPPAFVNKKDRPYVESKLTAHPTGTLFEPLKLTGALEKVKKRHISAPKNSHFHLSTRHSQSARPTNPGKRSKRIPITSSCSMSRIG